jgi:hypothetical protein
MQVGYKLATEAFGPQELVRQTSAPSRPGSTSSR